jgi:hypothetical protein
MFASFYNIDLKKLSRISLPKSKRKAKRLARIYAAIYAASEVFQQLMRFRKAKLYQLMITPQVCYLERLLNDRWDFTQRRIRIVDGSDKPPLFIYQEAEEKPVFIYQEEENQPVFIYTEGESETITDDFIIQVPVAVSFDINEMKSLVKAYKLAGTKFNIQIIY